MCCGLLLSLFFWGNCFDLLLLDGRGVHCCVCVLHTCGDVFVFFVFLFRGLRRVVPCAGFVLGSTACEQGCFCVFSFKCAVLPCARVCCFHVSLLCVVGTFIFRLSCSVAVTFCLPRKAIPWLCWFHCPPFIALFCCFTMNLEIAFDSDCVHQHCCRLLECS